MTDDARRRLFALAWGIAVFVLTTSAGLARQPADSIEASIREVLHQYSTALASLDADAVKKVQPSIDADGLRRAFRDMKTLEVVIDSVKVLSSDASVARVSCRVVQTLTPKAGARRATDVTRVVRLRRLDRGWVIDSFER